MKLLRSLVPLVLVSGCAMAQTPIFGDGAAVGGSRVFSEGLNPLGNSARFDRPASGVHLGWTQGDEGDKKTFDALKSIGDITQLSGNLAALTDQGWAQRTRAFGVAYVDRGVHSSLVHEETTGLLTQVNGPATAFDLRRAVVDRVAFGAGSFEQGSGYGMMIRVERWRTGQAIQPLPLGQTPDFLAYADTQHTAVSLNVDFGYTRELMTGLRFGATVDRLVPRHFRDVYEQPQLRLGFQMDLGTFAQVSLDSDVNKAMRMPFPVRQRITTASLRLMPNAAFSVTLGAERRSVNGQAQIKGGANLMFQASTWRIGAGLQLSQDRPMTAFTYSWF